jgi:hypothetical protein
VFQFRPHFMLEASSLGPLREATKVTLVTDDPLRFRELLSQISLRTSRCHWGFHRLRALSELRLRKDSPSSQKRRLSVCGRSSLFIVGRERAKLGYFWRHAYRVPHSGLYAGCVVNSDTGKPVIVDDSRLTAGEFEKVKIAETIETREGRS